MCQGGILSLFGCPQPPAWGCPRPSQGWSKAGPAALLSVRPLRGHASPGRSPGSALAQILIGYVLGFRTMNKCSVWNAHRILSKSMLGSWPGVCRDYPACAWAQLLWWTRSGQIPSCGGARQGLGQAPVLGACARTGRAQTGGAMGTDRTRSISIIHQSGGCLVCVWVESLLVRGDCERVERRRWVDARRRVAGTVGGFRRWTSRVVSTGLGRVRMGSSWRLGRGRVGR